VVMEHRAVSSKTKLSREVARELPV
jgi:hypothetical protein